MEIRAISDWYAVKGELPPEQRLRLGMGVRAHARNDEVGDVEPPAHEERGVLPPRHARTDPGPSSLVHWSDLHTFTLQSMFVPVNSRSAFEDLLRWRGGEGLVEVDVVNLASLLLEPFVEGVV
jgi:hypothetical protein